jgi:hypothetical protein
MEEPAMPAWSDVSKPEFRAQHSRVERLWRAPSTVTLRVEPRGAYGVLARIADGRMNWARVEGRILMGCEIGEDRRGESGKEKGKLRYLVLVKNLAMRSGE